MLSRGVCVGALLIMTGCATGDRPTEQPNISIKRGETLLQTLVYECANYEFVSQLSSEGMTIWLQDRQVMLLPERSASGTKYGEGDVELWTKGEQARLSVGSVIHKDCQLAPDRAPWEDARRRGVNFRAFGEQPDWQLEIRDERHLLFIGGRSMNRILAPNPEVSLESGTRVYRASTPETEVRVQIVDELCSDFASGDSYPSRVTVYVNSKRYRGCGSSLDLPWR